MAQRNESKQRPDGGDAAPDPDLGRDGIPEAIADAISRVPKEKLERLFPPPPAAEKRAWLLTIAGLTSEEHERLHLEEMDRPEVRAAIEKQDRAVAALSAEVAERGLDVTTAIAERILQLAREW